MQQNADGGMIKNHTGEPATNCNAYCETCDTGLIITGIGTYTKRTHPDTGGLYFCNEGCAQTWDAKQSEAESPRSIHYCANCDCCKSNLETILTVRVIGTGEDKHYCDVACYVAR